MKNVPADWFFLTCAFRSCDSVFNRRFFCYTHKSCYGSRAIVGGDFCQILFCFHFYYSVLRDLSFKNNDYKPARFICNFHFGYFILLYLLCDLQQRITIDKCFSRGSDSVVYTNTYINFWFLFYS